MRLPPEAVAEIKREQDAAREKREWWAIDTDGERVVKVTGLSCAPNNPGYWWVPELGSSMNENYHLFTTEAAALDKYISDLERLATETQERIVANRLRRSRL